MNATPFCIPGLHAVDVATQYTLVRASLVDGEWVVDPESPASIVVCEHHTIEGK